MRKETERKILRQVVYNIELERDIDPGLDPDDPDLTVLDDEERRELAHFLLKTEQATVAEIAAML